MSKYMVSSFSVLLILLVGILIINTQLQRPQKISSFAQASTTNITILQSSYSPDTLYILPDTTVTWTNKSTNNVLHTSTSDTQSGQVFWDSGQLLPGQSYSYTFKTVGVYPYHDTIYPTVNGIIIVTNSLPSPTIQLTPAQNQISPTPEVIDMINNEFLPKQATVSPGTIVTWVNEDTTDQSTTSISQSAAESWSSGLLMPGQSYSRQFNTPGSYPYFSSTDSSLSANITVSDASYSDVVTSQTTPGVVSPTTETTPQPTIAGVSPTQDAEPTSVVTTPLPTGAQGGFVQSNNDMQIQVSVKIPGIGLGGNVKPINLTRAVQVNVYAVANTTNGSANTPTVTGNGFLLYDGSNYFTGVIHLDLPNGVYYFTVHVPYTLSKLVMPQFQTLSFSQLNVLPVVTVVPGDVLNQDVLNIQDYNAFLSDILACNDVQNCPDLSIIDLNNDGVANATDYNILLQSFATVQGQ